MNVLKNILRKVDIYGNDFKLLINKNTKIKTKLGIFFSIITYLFFIYFFINEFEDVWFKKNPIIFSYDVDDYRLNNSFKSKLPELPFFISVNDNEILQYITTEFRFNIELKNKSMKYIYGYFENCTIEEIDTIKTIGEIDRENVNLCPRNLTRVLENEIFQYYLFLSINKCKINSSCYNSTFYEELSQTPNIYYFYLRMLTSQKTLDDYDNPFEDYFSYESISLGGNRNNLALNVKKEEIRTKGGLFYNENTEDKNFKILGREYYSKENTYLNDKYLGTFKVWFVMEIGIYQRNYKNVSSALAHCFSLLKLIKFIFAYLAKKNSYYARNSILTNNIFDFNNSFNKSIVNDDKINLKSDLIIDDINSSHKSFFNKKEKSTNQNNNKFQLSICNKIRLIFCTKKKLQKLNNRNFKFYNTTKIFIDRYTSIERFIKNSIQLDILKSLILNKSQHMILNKMNKLIIENDSYPIHTEIYNSMMTNKSNDFILTPDTFNEKPIILEQERLEEYLHNFSHTQIRESQIN